MATQTNRDAQLVRQHVENLRQAAAEARIPDDVLGRLIVQEAIDLWQSHRDWRDIANELHFIADHLDPETDYEFMRP